jgi:hypothetical protein
MERSGENSKEQLPKLVKVESNDLHDLEQALEKSSTKTQESTNPVQPVESNRPYSGMTWILACVALYSTLCRILDVFC